MDKNAHKVQDILMDEVLPRNVILQWLRSFRYFLDDEESGGSTTRFVEMEMKQQSWLTLEQIYALRVCCSEPCSPRNEQLIIELSNMVLLFEALCSLE